MRMVFPARATGRLMDDLATDVGTLVESFFGDVSQPTGHAMSVPMDIDESDQSYVLTLDVPGVALESIAIDVHEDQVMIAGERRSDDRPLPTESAQTEDSDEVEPQPALRRQRRERPGGKFERRVRLPNAIEHDSVTAELSDGVLVVTLPKADPEKGKRRIPVSRA